MSAVSCIRERGGKVSAHSMEWASGPTMREFIRGNTSPSGTIYSDDSTVYASIGDDTARHRVDEFLRGEVHSNRVGSVWSFPRRSPIGTAQHVSVKHLARFNEAAFRLNDSNVVIDTLDRMKALFSRVGGKRLRCRNLVGS